MFPKSPSRTEFEDGLGINKSNGADLTEYKQQLLRERNSRSLSLRSSSRPSISNFIKKQNKTNENLGYDVKSSIAKTISIIHSGDESQIKGFADSITNADPNNFNLVRIISKSPEVANALTSCITDGISEDLSAALCDAIAIMVPLGPKHVNVYIDEGLCFSLNDYISSDNQKLLKSAVVLIGVMSEVSCYARDSFLCQLDIHTNLAELALKTDNQDLQVTICTTLSKIFANDSEKIDYKILSDSVAPLAPLLDIKNVRALHSVISCLKDMANQMSTLVLKFYDLGIFTKVIQFVKDPELADVTLKLISVLSIGQPSHVRLMLDEGLQASLMDLIDTVHSADVFCIFANLIDTLGSGALDFFDSDFIKRVVKISEESGHKVKKRIALFLSTFALHADREHLCILMITEVLDILIEILGGDLDEVSERIIDCITRIVENVAKAGDQKTFAEVLDVKELRYRLKDIIDGDSEFSTFSASSLFNLLDSVFGSSQ